MVAASVARQVMALEVAKPRPDPRWVATPLDPDQVEELLCKYGIISNWSHIIMGLWEGFDIRIHKQLSRMYIFQQPHLIPDFISMYIAGEQAAGRYLEAFLPEDLKLLIGLFRTSPLGLVPKPHLDTF